MHSALRLLFIHPSLLPAILDRNKKTGAPHAVSPVKKPLYMTFYGGMIRIR